MGIGFNREGHLASREFRLQFSEFLIKDACRHRLIHVAEYDRCRQTVQEFRLESFLYLCQHGLATAYPRLEANPCLGGKLSTGIACHDDNHISEV